MSQPSLAVQIVNFRTSAYLPACLESLLAVVGGAPVWVLDNASGDDLAPIAEAFPSVTVLHAERNAGFGAGHNRLAREHGAELLCLVNPDVVVDRGDVLDLLRAELEDPRVAVAGPRLRTPDGAPQRFDHGELRGVRAFVAARAGHAYWRPRDEPADVAWVSGAFMVVRRSAFEAVGGFDEDFFLYKEEEDLCLRIRRQGGRIRYVPQAEARHVGGVVAGRDPALLAASTERFRTKHARHWRWWDPLYRHVTRRLV